VTGESERHVYLCPLRWADMDVYGIVNNVMYLRYLEEARVDLVHRMDTRDGDAFFRGGSVVVRHEIDYKRQLVHRLEPVEIQIWVTEVQAAAVTVRYVVRDGPVVYATAATVMAPYDYERNRPRRLSDGERAFFERYAAAPSLAAG
jgi:acyl-CoA thioester hydrolase